jgi:hypothetical protein
VSNTAEKVVFSGKVMKYNPMGWKQERNLLVTDRTIFNLKKKCM